MILFPDQLNVTVAFLNNYYFLQNNWGQEYYYLFPEWITTSLMQELFASEPSSSEEEELSDSSESEDRPSSDLLDSRVSSKNTEASETLVRTTTEHSQKENLYISLQLEYLVEKDNAFFFWS